MTPESGGAARAGNDHDKSQICGYRNPWSLGMRFDPGEGDTVHGRIQGNAELQGYQGTLHGGVLAALLDPAMAHCLFHCGVQGVTVDLHVRFVQPVFCAATLDVRAHVLRATPPLFG